MSSFNINSQRRGMFGTGSEPTMHSDMPNIPGLPAPAAVAANIAWMQFSPSVYGAEGLLPGIFAPQGNIYDQFAAREYERNRQTAMQAAQGPDVESFVRMQRELAKLMDTPFGPKQESAARALGTTAASFEPLVAAIAPDLVDAIHGSRGSSVVMASNMHRANRNRVDPVTGRIGVSGESGGAITSAVHEQLYGAGADLSRMMGIGAGRAGAMLEELNIRGIAGSSIGSMSESDRYEALKSDNELVTKGLRTLRDTDRPKFDSMLKDIERKTGSPAGQSPDAQIRALASTEEGTTAAVQTLRDAGSPQLETALRQFDGNKIANRIKGLVGAVTAMRDIFGDAGRPDAPMSELLSGLDQLSQGGLASMSPGQLGTTLRTSYETAKQAGVGLDQLAGFTGQMAQRADMLGLNRGFALPVASQAINFGAAYGDVGRGDVAAFGRVDKEQLTAADAQLRMNAAGSSVANIIGATLRSNAASEFKPGSEAANLIAAVKENRDTVNIGGKEVKIRDITPTQFMDVMESSGVGRETAAGLLRGTNSNQEFILEEGVQDYVRGQQAGELVDNLYSNNFGNAVSALVSDPESLGISRDKMLAIQKKVGTAVSGSLVSMNPADRAVRSKRNAQLSETMRNTLLDELTDAQSGRIEELTRQNGGDAGVARQQVRREMELKLADQLETGDLNNTVEDAVGNIDREIQRPGSQYAGLGSFQTSLDLMNPAVEQQRRARQKQFKQSVQMQEALAPLGRSSLINRVLKQLDQPADSFAQAVGQIAGGISQDAINAALKPMEAELQQAGATGDLEAMNAIKFGGTKADAEIKRIVDASGKSTAEFEAEGQKSLETQEKLARAAGLPLAEVLASGSADAEKAKAYQKYKMMQDAKKYGGISGLKAEERLKDQFKSLRLIREQINAADTPEKKDELLKWQSALISGDPEQVTDAIAAAESAIVAAGDDKEAVAANTAIRDSLKTAAEEGGMTTTAAQLEGNRPETSGKRELDRYMQLQEQVKAIDAQLADPKLTAEQAAELKKERSKAIDSSGEYSRAVIDTATEESGMFRKMGARKGATDAAGKQSPVELVSAAGKARDAIDKRLKELGVVSLSAGMDMGDPELLKAVEAEQAAISEMSLRSAATEDTKAPVNPADMANLPSRRPDDVTGTPVVPTKTTESRGLGGYTPGSMGFGANAYVPSGQPAVNTVDYGVETSGMPEAETTARSPAAAEEDKSETNPKPVKITGTLTINDDKTVTIAGTTLPGSGYFR